MSNEFDPKKIIDFEKDYYEILGVERGVDDGTLKKNYRKLLLPTSWKKFLAKIDIENVIEIIGLRLE